MRDGRTSFVQQRRKSQRSRWTWRRSTCHNKFNLKLNKECLTEIFWFALPWKYIYLFMFQMMQYPGCTQHCQVDLSFMENHIFPMLPLGDDKNHNWYKSQWGENPLLFFNHKIFLKNLTVPFFSNWPWICRRSNIDLTIFYSGIATDSTISWESPVAAFRLICLGGFKTGIVAIFVKQLLKILDKYSLLCRDRCTLSVLVMSDFFLQRTPAANLKTSTNLVERMFSFAILSFADESHGKKSFRGES